MRPASRRFATGARSAFGRDRLLQHHLRGLYFAARGQHARAAEAFRRAVFSTTGGYTRTNLELGRSLLRLGRAQDAIAILRAAFRGPLDSSGFYATQTQLHQLLGRAFEAAGHPDSAAVHYRRVLAAWDGADPEFRSPRDSVAARLARLGRR